MEPKELIVHACEQVMRFTQVANWNDLNEERKVQLGFNMGIVALGLGLSKDQGYVAMSHAREGVISMQVFREHLHGIIAEHGILISDERIARPF